MMVVSFPDHQGDQYCTEGLGMRPVLYRWSGNETSTVAGLGMKLVLYRGSRNETSSVQRVWE